MGIDSNLQILIINDNSYLDEGGFEIIIPLLFCCSGFIGIIISIIMVFSSSNKTTMMENKQEIIIINPDLNEVGAPNDNSSQTSEWWEISGENKS